MAMDAEVKIVCVVTCPMCGHRAEETMPTDACLISYKCVSCGARLRSKRGECCVFCRYGDVACPAVQQGRLEALRSITGRPH
jgi:hypothetical protein